MRRITKVVNSPYQKENELLYESPQRPISFELQAPLEEIFYQYQWLEGSDIDSQVYLSEDALYFFQKRSCPFRNTM